MKVVLLFLVFILGHPNDDFSSCITTHVDCVEINHLYTNEGKQQFTQLILWNYVKTHRKDNRSIVRWIIYKDGYEDYSPEKVKQIKNRLEDLGVDTRRYTPEKWIGLKNLSYNSQTGRYTLIITFLGSAVIHKIVFRSLKETWTQKDPELKHREIQPKEERAGLFKPSNILQKSVDISHQ